MFLQWQLLIECPRGSSKQVEVSSQGRIVTGSGMRKLKGCMVRHTAPLISCVLSTTAPDTALL